MSNRINLTTPVGRLVMGSLYKGTDKDAEGKPLVFKTGAQAGQPRLNYFVALAIPKQGEAHWNQTAWGSQIWAVGAQAFPQAHQSPSFSWKIEDGDSMVPNKRGRKPSDNEGWKGCWVLKFGGAYAPKVYRLEGSGYVQETQVDYVKPGYFIEVNCSVEGNGSQSQPGIYLNHSMVCFRAYGEEIVFGPDVASAGFGQSALPVGASAAPLAAAVPPVAPAVAAPAYMPPTPPAAAPAYMPPTPPAAVATPTPPAVPVVPNAQFVNPGLPPTPPAAPAPAPTRRMSVKANGVSYEAYVANGWTDAQLIAHGLLEV